MGKRVYILTYEADTEGHWLSEDVAGRWYETEYDARAAWQRTYLGPDEYGAEAYPVIRIGRLGVNDIATVAVGSDRYKSFPRAAPPPRKTAPGR